MPTPEDAVKKSVENKLNNLQHCGDIIWYSRLQSGKVKSEYGGWMQLCEKGTPDFICVFRNKSNELTVLFIECKRPDVPPKLNESQQIFFELYDRKHKNFILTIVTDVKQVSEKILTLGYDRLADINFGN
jgi:hypothetical protein